MTKIKTQISILLFPKRNKILAWLTGILLIMLLLIIKFCDIPLWLPEQYFSFLLCDPDSDKTLYNIAISYLAAYLFYIIQVHIPTVQKETRAYKSVRKQLSEIIRKAKEIIYIFHEMYDVNDMGEISEKACPIYFYSEYWDYYPNTAQRQNKVSKYKHGANNSCNSNRDFRDKISALKKKYTSLLANASLQKCDENLVDLLEQFAVDKLCASMDSAIIMMSNQDLVEQQAHKFFTIPSIIEGVKEICDKSPGLSYDSHDDVISVKSNGQTIWTGKAKMRQIHRSSSVLEDIENAQNISALLEKYIDVDADISFRSCTEQEIKQLQQGKEFTKIIQQEFEI